MDDLSFRKIYPWLTFTRKERFSLRGLKLPLRCYNMLRGSQFWNRPKTPLQGGLRRSMKDGEYDSSGITILKCLELKFSKSFSSLQSPSHILRRSKTYSPSSCRSPVHGWIGTCAWYCEREHCPRLTLPWLKYRDFPCNSNDGTIGKRVQGHKLRTATANMGGIPAVKWLKYHT